MGNTVKLKAAAGLLALLLLLLLAWGGCGEAGITVMPVQVLDPVQVNTFSAGSYRVTGDLQVTMVTRTGQGKDQGLFPLFVKIPFTADYERYGESGILKITADMTGFALPDEFPYFGGDRQGVAYVTANRLYVDDPGGGWHYRAYDFAGKYGTLGITPESVRYWIDGADHLEVVEEQDSFIKYSVVDSVVEEAEDGLDVSHYVTVDKETMMILEEELSIGGYLDSLLEDTDAMKSPTKEPAEQDTYVIVKRSYRFSDFGRSFHVHLPEAAERATEAKTSLIGF